MSRDPSAETSPPADSAAQRLHEAEALFRDFAEVTPFTYRPFVRSFDSFEEFEAWRRAQTNPWYR